MYRFSQRSLNNLLGVRPELIAIATHALLDLSSVDFGVTEGLRSPERQRELVRKGASQTLRSRHLTGHAIDLVAYVGSEIRWDWPLYEQIADAMKQSAEELRIPMEWGGDWKMRDGPHFQLPWKEYPA